MNTRNDLHALIPEHHRNNEPIRACIWRGLRLFVLILNLWLTVFVLLTL